MRRGAGCSFRVTNDVSDDLLGAEQSQESLILGTIPVCLPPRRYSMIPSPCLMECKSRSVCPYSEFFWAKVGSGEEGFITHGKMS